MPFTVAPSPVFTPPYDAYVGFDQTLLTQPEYYLADVAEIDVAIQEAIDNLTAGRNWIEKVGVQALDSELAHPIILPDYTHLHIESGRITAVNALNDNMVENEDQANGNEHVILSGGMWDGNNTEQANGHIIDFTNAGASTGAPVRIQDLYTFNAREDSIHIDGLFHRSIIRNVHLREADGQSISLEDTADWLIDRAWCHGGYGVGEDVLDIYVSFNNVFYGLYMTAYAARNLHMTASCDNMFYGIIADVTGTTSNNIRLDGGSNQNSFHGAMFTTNNMNNTVGLLRLQDSLRNSFHSPNFRFFGGDTCTSYIVEGGASDWNFYFCPKFEQAGVTGADTVLGGNSATINPIAW